MIKKEYCRCGPHPLQVTSSRARPPHVRERATLAPFSRNSGVGRSGSWPPLHCGDLTNSHRRLFMAPHCTLRPSHECGRECLETGDRGPTRHVGAGRWGLLGLIAHGLLGRRHTRAPASATWLGEVGIGSIEIPRFWEWGVRACAQVP